MQMFSDCLQKNCLSFVGMTSPSSKRQCKHRQSKGKAPLDYPISYAPIPGIEDVLNHSWRFS